MKRLLWPLAVVIVPLSIPCPSKPDAFSGPARYVARASPRTSHLAARWSGRRPRRHLTDPWAVVSAYYRDVDSHQYAKAWALISSGLATGQTYQQFVAGYACTGTEQPTKLGQSGHQVRFNLAVVNACTGAAQYYTGTDTVRGGKIVAADVTRTG